MTARAQILCAMHLTHREVALLQSYANLALGTLPAQVKVRFDASTEELVVELESRLRTSNGGELRGHRWVATLTEAQEFIATVIEEFRSGTRSLRY